MEEVCKENVNEKNLDKKTPLELTRPVRMRFKENRLRYLQAQIDFQNTQLNEVLQETESQRQYLRDVKQRNF
ncbi:hypothetical protein EVAR_72046_1 [Eumeta japonica]|uniref:Uncharacterized protein n=1 Tax=Eumeta variegata TaxID=151549 RepID=A0A4C1T4Y4_EUMVA|nr:hypothetical protein EVAR_72046_1 [Eumeta japonica]